MPSSELCSSSGFSFTFLFYRFLQKHENILTKYGAGIPAKGQPRHRNSEATPVALGAAATAADVQPDGAGPDLR
jgi:hypothetical protein